MITTSRQWTNQISKSPVSMTEDLPCCPSYLLPANGHEQRFRVCAADVARVSARIVVREGILLHIDGLGFNPLSVVVVGLLLIEACRISPHTLVG